MAKRLTGNTVTLPRDAVDTVLVVKFGVRYPV